MPRLWGPVLSRRVRDPNRIAFLAAAHGHAAAPWAPLMRLARSQPQLPAKRLFPAPLYGHLETSLEPVLPAILIHKDEDDGGNVTGPGAMPAGKAGSQPAGRRAGRRSIVRVLPQACEVDAVDEDLQ
jgi:hypothetical protein